MSYYGSQRPPPLPPRNPRPNVQGPGAAPYHHPSANPPHPQWTGSPPPPGQPYGHPQYSGDYQPPLPPRPQGPQGFGPASHPPHPGRGYGASTSPSFPPPPPSPLRHGHQHHAHPYPGYGGPGGRVQSPPQPPLPPRPSYPQANPQGHHHGYYSATTSPVGSATNSPAVATFPPPPPGPPPLHSPHSPVATFRTQQHQQQQQHQQHYPEPTLPNVQLPVQHSVSPQPGSSGPADYNYDYVAEDTTDMPPPAYSPLPGLSSAASPLATPTSPPIAEPTQVQCAHESPAVHSPGPRSSSSGTFQHYPPAPVSRIASPMSDQRSRTPQSRVASPFAEQRPGTSQSRIPSPLPGHTAVSPAVSGRESPPPAQDLPSELSASPPAKRKHSPSVQQPPPNLPSTSQDPQPSLHDRRNAAELSILPPPPPDAQKPVQEKSSADSPSKKSVSADSKNMNDHMSPPPTTSPDKSPAAADSLEALLESLSVEFSIPPQNKTPTSQDPSPTKLLASQQPTPPPDMVVTFAESAEVNPQPEEPNTEELKQPEVPKAEEESKSQLELPQDGTTSSKDERAARRASYEFDPFERRAPEPAQAPPAVTSCIDVPMTFTTEWYWHPDAADFLVCSRCYLDHIHGTRFRSFFSSETLRDGKPRRCSFSKARMKDVLFPEAVRTGSLHKVVDWMSFRPTVPECRGIDGVKGGSGTSWYGTKKDSGMQEGFLACQACYEDQVMNNEFHSYFEPYQQTHKASDIWACDMAIPYILKEYEEKGKKSDWHGFAYEAKARMSAPKCSGPAPVSTYRKNWFTPTETSLKSSLILCAACYCDQIIHTGEEAKWQTIPELSKERGKTVRCAMGVFNVKLAMARAHEKKDFSIWWNAMRQSTKEKFCDAKGITDGTWYTLHSNAEDDNDAGPEGFQICAACYIAIAEPLNVARFFKPKSVATGTTLPCCFNIAHPRLTRFLPRVLEMYLNLDPTALINYASTYASILPCPRFNPIPPPPPSSSSPQQQHHWYGWPTLLICSECYHEFVVSNSALRWEMPLQNVSTSELTTGPPPCGCELYSPRMRQLLLNASSTSPPDARPLLEFASQRRKVYAETVPLMREMLARQKAKLEQQKLLNVSSTYHNMAGQLEVIGNNVSGVRNAYTYGASGVGYGFANMDLLQGRALGQQAMGLMASGVGDVQIVRELEGRWKGVE